MVKTYWIDKFDLNAELMKENITENTEFVEVIKKSDMLKEIDKNYVLKSHLKLTFIPRKEVKEAIEQLESKSEIEKEYVFPDNKPRTSKIIINGKDWDNYKKQLGIEDG